MSHLLYGAAALLDRRWSAVAVVWRWRWFGGGAGLAVALVGAVVTLVQSRDPAGAGRPACDTP